MIQEPDQGRRRRQSAEKPNSHKLRHDYCKNFLAGRSRNLKTPYLHKNFSDISGSWLNVCQRKHPRYDDLNVADQLIFLSVHKVQNTAILGKIDF